MSKDPNPTLFVEKISKTRCRNEILEIGKTIYYIINNQHLDGKKKMTSMSTRSIDTLMSANKIH